MLKYACRQLACTKNPHEKAALDTISSTQDNPQHELHMKTVL